MYKLTLTLQEIVFLEWAKGRYFVGDILPLISEYCLEQNDGSTVYSIPEHIAWEVKGLIEEDTEDLEGIVPCASKELSDKLILWAMDVV